MTLHRFVECQCCGRVYQLPTTTSHLQSILSGQGAQHHCYATVRALFGQLLPCEGQGFREITVTEAEVWRGPMHVVVPLWYQPEYHALLAQTAVASLGAAAPSP